ncbi:SRPBCC family protein [Bacteroidota bacterium]
MKALKIIGIILLIIVALFFIVTLFLPKEMRFAESTEIKASAETVFNQVNDFQTWPKWSPWNLKDTNMAVTYEGPETGVGSISKWTSESQGNGSQEITESIPFTYIKSDLDFMEEGKATADWTLEETEEGTNVTWGMTIPDLKYPLGRFFMFLYKGQMIKDFQYGLENLKVYCESLPPPCEERIIPFDTEEGSFEIIEKCVDPKTSYIIRSMVTMEEISQKISESYMKLGEFCKEKGIEMTGAPFTAWPNFTMEGPTEMIAGFPGAIDIEGEGEIETYTIPESKVVMIVHKGSYNATMSAYNAIMKYIEVNKREINGPTWEEYITDPTTEPDTNNWITHIYYPVN